MLYDMLVNAFEDYNILTGTFTTQANTATYPISSSLGLTDFYKVRRIRYAY